VLFPANLADIKLNYTSKYCTAVCTFYINDKRHSATVWGFFKWIFPLVTLQFLCQFCLSKIHPCIHVFTWLYVTSTSKAIILWEIFCQKWKYLMSIFLSISSGALFDSVSFLKIYICGTNVSLVQIQRFVCFTLKYHLNAICYKQQKKGIARYWTKDKVLKKFWVLVKQCFVIILSCTWTPQWCEYDTQVHRIVLYWLQRRMYVCAYLNLCWFLFFYLFRHQCTEQRYSLDTTACCNISGAWKSMINNYFIV